MNCLDFQQLISAKLDKELTQDEEQILSEHLKICTNCASLAKELEELKVITSTWKNVQIPVELEKQILNRTVKTTRKERPVLSFLGGYYKVPRSLAWASILLCLILLVNSFLNPLSTIKGARKIEKPIQEISRVQKIVLTERDVVVTYTVLGKKN